MKKVLSRHDEIMADTIAAYEGRIIKHTGDGIFAVFEKGDALSCAIEIQKKLADENWPEINELRIRIGLHSGYAENRGDDYFGPVVNRTARITAAAWGGQILLTPEIVQSHPVPAQAKLKDLGAHMLKDLGEPQQIFQLDHVDLPMHEFPSLRSLSARPHNLPVQTAPFFGRSDELDCLKDLLSKSDSRLITVVGPGGMGKTRLALQAAAEQIERFHHGVYLVALAPLTSDNALVSSIAGTLKFSFYSREDEKTQLLNYLREKEMLLILDNFEHVMGGIDIVKDILSQVNKIKIIVTSREVLNLRGENVLNLRGMPFPDNGQDTADQFSSIQLFLYNAKRIDHKFELSDDNREDIIRVCQLVSGLPLGIELASSWLRHLPCKEIVTEIEKNMDFLATNQRDLPERHRSLRAIFNYSWDLLSDDERKVLKNLSIFQRGFTRKAAEKIAGTSLGLLASLIDKSLLRSDKSGRYELSAMVHNYANEKLREEEKLFLEIRDTYACFYLKWLGDFNKSENRSLSSEQLDDIHQDIDNIRAAWKYSIENEKLEWINEAVMNFCEFFRRRGLNKEGTELLMAACEHLIKHQETELYGKLMREQGRFLLSTSNIRAARMMLEKSLKIFRALDLKSEIAHTSNSLGEAMRLTGFIDDAKLCFEEAMSLYRQVGDNIGTARALNNLALNFESTGDYQKARQLAEQSLKISTATKDEQGTAHALNILGMVTHGTGEYEVSKKYYFDSVELSRRNKDKVGIARAMNNVANIFGLLGEFEQAKKYYQESLLIFEELGNNRGMAATLSNLGLIAHNQMELEESQALFERALKINRDIDYKIGIATTLSNMASVLDKKKDFIGAQKLQDEGLKIACEINDAWLIETSKLTMAAIFIGQNKFDKAKVLLGEAIETAIEKDHKPFIMQAFVTVGQLWFKEKKYQEALELLLYASNDPTINEPARKEALPTIKEICDLLDPRTSETIKEKVKGARSNSLVDMVLQDCRRAK